MGFLDEEERLALRQLRFLGRNRPAIFREFLRNAPKAGYVFVSADSAFEAVEPPFHQQGV